MNTATRDLFTVLLSTAAIGLPAAAQCANPFVPTLQLPGTDGVVRAATVWDRDGAGPLPPLLVLGGSFTQAGSTSATNIVAYDPATGAWSALGTGVSKWPTGGEVLALATAQNGDLIVGGDFYIAGGQSNTYNVARFDGTNWAQLGTGLSAPVRALAVLPGGDVVAGGDFQTSGSSTFIDRVARWNGSSWSAVGVGPNATVRALAVLQNGDLVAGGDFTQAGGNAASRVTRWNGTAWSALGSGMNATVRAFGVQGTTLWAGGDFSTAGGMSTYGVASWNGAAWTPSLNYLANTTRVHAIAVAGTSVYIGGNAVGSGAFNSIVASFDGMYWLSLDANANTSSTAYVLAVLPDGRLAAAGAFDNVNGVPIDNVAFRSPLWRAVGALSGRIGRVVARPDGSIVAVGDAYGDFTAPGIAGSTSVALFDGVRWTSLQSGVVGTAQLAVTMPGGDVVVYAHPFGASANCYRWNGSVWTQLGTLPFFVLALTVSAGGEPLICGYGAQGNQLARWDGVNWVSSPGAPGFQGQFQAMVALPGGDVVVGGTDPGGYTQIPSVSFWRWNGSVWAQMGATLTSLYNVRSMVVLQDGTLVAGGDFAALQWNGTAWTTLGAGAPFGVNDLLPLSNGDLLACGSFTAAGGVSANRIARWDGASWRPVGPGPDRDVSTMAVMPNGDVIFAGSFTRMGGAPSPGMVRLTTTCPASAIAVGGPCLGSAGPLRLRADALPWIGGAFRATATTFAATSLGARVLGLQPLALPLVSLHPTGNPACSLLARPDDVAMLLPAAGAATFAVAVPEVATLIGTQAYCQVLQLELDPQLQPTALLGSNALMLTVGSF